MFGKLFGGKNKSGSEPNHPKAAPPAPNMIGEDDPCIAEGDVRMKAAWDDVGPSDADVITYLINPQFQGKPAWPNTRQAYRVVRPAGSLIIASDGLSDPFVGTDMADTQGFGCEVYIEAPEFAGADFHGLRHSWAFSLIENFAMNVANWGGISRQLEQNGVLSMELPAQDQLPDAWLTPDGNAGFLIGVPAPNRPKRIDMPFGPVDLVALTLLTPNELQRIVSGGANGRKEIAAELAVKGVSHISRVDRL